MQTTTLTSNHHKVATFRAQCDVMMCEQIQHTVHRTFKGNAGMLRDADAVSDKPQ